MPAIGVGAGHQDKPPPRPSPGIGGGLGSIGRSLPPPPAPRGGVGAGLGNVGRTAAKPAAHYSSQPQTDIQSSGSGYGMQQAAAFKQTSAYRQAVAAVFKAQSARSQAGIIQGLARMPHSPEGAAIGSVWAQLDPGRQQQIVKFLPPNLGKQLMSFSLSKAFQGVDLGHALTSFIQHNQPYGETQLRGISESRSPGSTVGEMALGGLGSAASKLIQALPIGAGATGSKSIQAATGGVSSAQFVKNFAKDIVNTPAEILSSGSIVANDAIHGHFKKALGEFTQPYVELAKDPKGFIGQHPGDAFLMASPFLHGVTRAAEVGGRTILGKGPVDLTQESVHLTGKLTHERPHSSPFPLIRQGQKTVAKQLYERGPNGELQPRADAVRNRLTRLETSRLVMSNERVRRMRREQQTVAHGKSVLVSRAARGVHAVKTALAYNPKAPLIPGADVLSLIADGTIRRPETLAADLQKVRSEVAATRPDLLGMPKALADHDKFVAEVDAALKNKAFLRNPKAAFRAATRYGHEYPAIEAAAHSYGHFRDMTKDALERRALAHIVLRHMPDARYDPARGLMVGNRPLTTAEMRAFAHRETGGRPIAFTSDQPRSGDRAFMVSGQRRPRVTKNARNTYFAYHHGLTSPSHEALLEQRVRTQGIVDAHRSMNRLADQLLLVNEKTGRPKAWTSYDGAQRDAPAGYVPIRLAQAFHPSASLKRALDTGKVNMTALEEEAARRALDINARLQPSSEPGTWGLIHEAAADQLRSHENLISPGVFFRGLRSFQQQWRKVALGTSFRHLPGVTQEVLLRAAASGTGVVSWLAGRASLRGAESLDRVLGEERRVHLTGGMQAGQVLAIGTRQVSRHYEGTLLHGPLRAFEAFTKTPGPRQLTTLWRSWMKLTLNGTKHFLEEQSQVAALGKTVIRDFGGDHGVLAAAMGTWGKMIDQAAHGILDESTARRFRVEINRVYGRWTDLTPGEQQALLASPFGMWWTNSIAFLGRFPVDHPILSGPAGAVTVGTEKERQKLGLDMFAPGHLPLYKQGAVLVGGKLWQANYYSPMGAVNNPAETAGSLILPWATGLINPLWGANPFFSEMTSPTHPKGGSTNVGTRFAVMMNSLGASVIPLYSKAQTIVEGGAPRYDTSTLAHPQTKRKGSLGAGLVKAVMPVRLTTAGAKTPSAGAGSGWDFGGGGASKRSGGGSSGGWDFGGGGSSSSGSGSGNSGGWDFGS